MKTFALLVGLAAMFGADAPEAPLVAGRDVPLPARSSGMAPIYPEIARRAGIEAMILLRVTLATDGHPTDITVLRGIPLLDMAAIDAVKTWRYDQTVVGGVPRRVDLVEAVPFFADDGELSRAFTRLVGDRSQPSYLRVAAIFWLAGLPTKEQKWVSKTLQKFVSDPDEAVARAAAAAFAAIGNRAK